MLKAKILMNLFKDNSYFTDLSDYIKNSVEKDNLSYENLKYIYDNLYKHQSQFIKQNIYPVCEFLKKCYSFEECERLANLLQDAKELSIFCYNSKDKGKTYNKLFNDLVFVYNNYDKYINKYGGDKEVAYSKTKEQLELTSTFQRQIESQISCGEILLENEINDYEKQILKKLKEQKRDIIRMSINDKSKIINATQRYNRLTETMKDLKKYKNSLYKESKSKGYNER